MSYEDIESEENSSDISNALFHSAFKYTCSFPGCHLQFKRRDQFDSHEFTHSNVKKFKCTEENCAKAYVNNAHLQRHKRAQHNHSSEIVQCKYEGCPAYFSTETKMKQHCSNIHSGASYEFECDICSSKFRRKTQLRKHMFAHTGNYRYKCMECDKGFLQLGHLKRHENSHKWRQCNHCDETFEKWSTLVAHKQKEHAKVEIRCTVCNKVFHSKRGLKHHKQTHIQLEDRNIYQCTFNGCTKFFFQRKNMLAHFKSKHECRKFICPESGCGQQLSTNQKLKQHIEKMHCSGNIGCRSNRINHSDPIQRAKRKDKGTQKISTASKLFNIILPMEVEQAIIAGRTDNIYFNREVIAENDQHFACKNLDISVKNVDSHVESVA